MEDTYDCVVDGCISSSLICADNNGYCLFFMFRYISILDINDGRSISSTKTPCASRVVCIGVSGVRADFPF